MGCSSNNQQIMGDNSKAKWNKESQMSMSAYTEELSGLRAQLDTETITREQYDIRVDEAKPIMKKESNKSLLIGNRKRKTLKPNMNKN